MTRGQPAQRLQIRAAQDGGFVVEGPPAGQLKESGYFETLFAGPIDACLGYIRDQMAPPHPMQNASNRRDVNVYGDAREIVMGFDGVAASRTGRV